MYKSKIDFIIQNNNKDSNFSSNLATIADLDPNKTTIFMLWLSPAIAKNFFFQTRSKTLL